VKMVRKEVVVAGFFHFACWYREYYVEIEISEIHLRRKKGNCTIR
jgi:hypothetical protein